MKFVSGAHMVYTALLCCTSSHAFSPALGIVVEAIDHGTVADHQGDFIPEVFQNPMFSDVSSVCLSGLGTPDSFAQGCKSIVVAVVVTAMQTMRHPVRSLRPPPDIALECIC